VLYDGYEDAQTPRSRLAVVVAVLATFSVPSEAGYYTVSFTGGNVHVTDSDPPCAEDSPFGGSYGIWGGQGTTRVCGDPPGVAGQGTVACTGSLTCTITWNPSYANERPPLRVAVQEYAEAHWDGDSGACANGLGNAPVGSQCSKTSSGERWTLKTLNGANQVTLNLSPSASAEYSTGDCGNPAGAAWVTWAVAAHDVDIVLGGLTWDGVSAWKPMVGQQVVATLVCPDWPDNTRSWSIPKGDKFADYQASVSSATVTPYVNGSTAASTSFFCRNPSSPVTVKCNVFLGGPLQQAVSLQRNVVPREPAFDLQVRMGEVKLASPQNYLEIALLDAPLIAGDYVNFAEPWVGMRFGALVDTPTPWDTGNSGYAYFTQLLGPERFMTVSGQEVPHPWNQFVGCDGELFPYAGVVWNATGPSGRIVGDAPGQGLEPPATQYRIAQESFKTYVMYAPPYVLGYESRFVALREISWSWSGTANYVGSHWQGPSGADAEFTKTGDFPVQPTWTYSLPPGP